MLQKFILKKSFRKWGMETSLKPLFVFEKNFCFDSPELSILYILFYAYDSLHVSSISQWEVIKGSD